ncbi:MAG: aconitate hydratase AcnA [Gemmatimonadota bacterium]
MNDSFRTRKSLSVHGDAYSIWSLPALAERGLDISRLPYALKILLENLLRHEDGHAIDSGDIEALANWDPAATPSREIMFTPARVLLQDFTGVPALVDLGAMRDAMAEMGGDPAAINPQVPADLVIDHSVQVDAYGREAAFLINAEREYERNRERYAFLRWGQTAFDGFRVVPPDTGIVHQVNLEYLGRVVFASEIDGDRCAYPDTLVGTDSHTTMINGLGILGWGVGGIEAEAAMLGQPIAMLIPQVVGFKLYGTLPEGATATDLVLRVTEMLRERGVVGKFVEFYGQGIGSLSLADRATIGNMSPEYGATCAIFPIDQETIEYLRFTGRDEKQVTLVEAYAKEQGVFHTPDAIEAEYSETLELDLATVEPSLAGPKLPQRRIALSSAKATFALDLTELFGIDGGNDVGERAVGRWDSEGGGSDESAVAVATSPRISVTCEARDPDTGAATFDLHHGSVVIAAITSCTNTSNPSVMIGAGLLARNAVSRGLTTRPWVKTSLAPGSMVVTEYLKEAGLMDDLEALGFHLVGYGCTTCIGNSGPLAPPVSEAIRDHELVACSVLSGNRNFEGRINPDTRANYLASPPLVVAYALSGRMDLDLTAEPLGQDRNGNDVYLADIWPSQREITDTVRAAVKTEQFRAKYAHVFEGDERWHELEIPAGDRFAWTDESTYIRRPTFLSDIPAEPTPPDDIENARALALLGNSVTTDHISPAGSIPVESPAGQWLIAQGVEPREFNSYGSRRGNHEVMMRGTFANIRLRNRLAPGTEGGWTRHQPSGEQMTIYEAAVRYASEGVPLIAIAGKEYGSGSSRDWAAKGTLMLGIRAVIADSYERIHRSNLIGMGVLPLQFAAGENAETVGLTGEEAFTIRGVSDLSPGAKLEVVAESNGDRRRFEVVARIDTPVELDYYRHGGILPYVLRDLRARGT